MEEQTAGGNRKDSQQNTTSGQTPSTSLDEMMNLFRQIFKDDGTLRIRVINNIHSDGIRCGLVYVDGMVDREMISTG